MPGKILNTVTLRSIADSTRCSYLSYTRNEETESLFTQQPVDGKWGINRLLSNPRVHIFLQGGHCLLPCAVSPKQRMNLSISKF